MRYRTNYDIASIFPFTKSSVTGMSLEPLGIASGDNEGFAGRRIEAMTPLQVRMAIIGYGVCIVLIQIAMLLGPPFRISKTVPFDGRSLQNPYRKFSFNFSQMNYWNDFLVCDLLLDNASKGSSALSLHFTAIAVKGSVTTERAYDISKELVLVENVSQKLRIFENDIVDFESLNVTVLMDKGSAIFDGAFIWSYADPAHSIVQMFLRITFFFIATAMLLFLLFSGFNICKTHITMRLMFFLDLVMLLASDPFYVVTYFDDFANVKVMDTLLNMFLVICVHFTALIVLRLKGLVHRDVGFWWLAVRFLPFLVAYFVFIAHSILEIVFLGRDPLSESTTATRALAATKITLILLYAVVLFMSAVKYRTDLVQEYDAAILGAGFSFATLMFAELAKAFETLLAGGFAVEKFTFWSCSVYIILFNMFNWPVHPSLAMRDEDTLNDNQLDTTVL